MHRLRNAHGQRHSHMQRKAALPPSRRQSGPMVRLDVSSKMIRPQSVSIGHPL
jgi:hypothetical protein